LQHFSIGKLLRKRHSQFADRREVFRKSAITVLQHFSIGTGHHGTAETATLASKVGLHWRVVVSASAKGQFGQAVVFSMRPVRCGIHFNTGYSTTALASLLKRVFGHGWSEPNQTYGRHRSRILAVVPTQSLHRVLAYSSLSFTLRISLSMFTLLGQRLALQRCPK